MTKPSTKAIAGIVACLVATLVIGSATAVAGTLFERHYGEKARIAGKPVEGDYAEGFKPKLRALKGGGRGKAGDPLDYPLSIGEQVKTSSGTMIFRVKFDSHNAGNPAWFGGQGTLFTLMDAKGKYIMTASVTWGEAVPPWFAGAGLGALEISSDIMPSAVWGGWIPFDRKIAMGESATIAFTWDNGVNQVYLNGTPLKAKYGAGWDNNSRMVARGDFGKYLQGVKTLRIGADNEVENSPLQAAVVTGVEIHDRALSFAPPKPVIGSVSDDTFKVPGISGKLVAGDTVTATLNAVPGGKASFDLGKVKGVPMAELPPAPGSPGNPAVDNGTYLGSYRIKPGDDFEIGQIVGQFVSADNVSADPVLSKAVWTIDTKPVVSFQIDRKDLPADSATRARIKLVAKDANGVVLKGRRLILTLSTTDEYTGTVGAGDFGKQVGATIETRWKGETDAWGELEFDYTSGFAAKTVILQAKDLDSGGVSVDYLTAYKEASIDIALTSPISRAAARRGGNYILKVEATRTELTADGRSRSVIRATLTDAGGTPVAGDPVAFTLSTPNGTLRTIQGTTDKAGVAIAEYTAGKKIGIVVITATATLRNATGNVSIILLSDAPAKIYLKARPESLPADGNSRADLSVKVTDINDNPNKDTKVEFRLAKGGGKIEYPDRITDKFGDTANRYTSGNVPGIATILATVRSRVPSAAELSKARNVLFVPYNEAGEEIRIDKWLKKKGDAVLRGEAIVQYTIGRRGTELLTLNAPYDLTMGEIFIEYWNEAAVGQTLATVVPTVVPTLK